MLISGSVLDQDMRPIPWANIREVATGKLATADADGKFSITVQSANSVLRFSHAGFDYDEIKAGEFNSYYQLWPTMLDEVPVYGDKKPEEEPNNTLWYVLGAGIAGIMIAKLAKSGKPEPRRVKV